MTLSGRKVLITGANRGVGASFVEAALARQASTVYAAARNPALLPRFSDPARVVPCVSMSRIRRRLPRRRESELMSTC